MRWEELTGDLFPLAIEQTGGVCVLPLSCIERHAHHLPVGTDMYIAREICDRAARIEPVVVFPDFIFTQILEARHAIGTIAIDAELIVRLLDNVCREIARNGFKKIVILNAHGGNGALIPFFAQMQLQSPRDYVVYYAERANYATDHAGETETSMIQVIRPDLVRADQIRADGEGSALNRMAELRDNRVLTAIWWYADHPTHYAGDASLASPADGERLLDQSARTLVEAIQMVKRDTTAPRLQQEFFAASSGHGA